jgi:bifunctional DNA-binding transcriptional regulator/antitoxin component of YhaV-PrlF toxin-antitoxin module
MGEGFLATLTSEGQITVPTELLKAWGLKPGDQLAVSPVSERSSTMESRQKPGIFERIDELKLPEIGRPFTQQDIDNAVGEAMAEKELRSRGG